MNQFFCTALEELGVKKHQRILKIMVLIMLVNCMEESLIMLDK